MDQCDVSNIGTHTYAAATYDPCTAGLLPVPANALIYQLYVNSTVCDVEDGLTALFNLGSTGACVPFFGGTHARAQLSPEGIITAALYCHDSACKQCDVPVTMVASCQELGPSASWTILPGAKLKPCKG